MSIYMFWYLCDPPHLHFLFLLNGTHYSFKLDNIKVFRNDNMLITNVINKNVDVLYCFLCNCVYRKQSVILL